MRILCAVDGSEQAQWGVRALETFTGRELEQVTLLHVVDPLVGKERGNSVP